MWEVFRPDYRAHEALIEEARRKPEIWRLLAGILIAIAIWMFLSNILANYVTSILSPEGQDSFWEAVPNGDTPGAMIFLLLQIGLLVPATGIAAAMLNGRTLVSLFGAWSLCMSQFLWVLAAQVALIVVLAILPPYSFGEGELSPGLPFGRWLVLLPLSLVAVVLQSAAEEYAFRGYIQQQLAARFQHPAVWVLLPSALFAWGHYDGEGAGENALAIACLAGIFGVLMADITARAGTLGPAIAIHVANNVLAMLFIGTPGSLSGLALYTLPFGLENETAVRALLPVEFASMVVSWLAARLVLRR